MHFLISKHNLKDATRPLAQVPNEQMFWVFELPAENFNNFSVAAAVLCAAAAGRNWFRVGLELIFAGESFMLVTRPLVKMNAQRQCYREAQHFECTRSAVEHELVDFVGNAEKCHCVVPHSLR